MSISKVTLVQQGSSSRGKRIIIAKQGDALVHTDELRPANHRDRLRFAQAISDAVPDADLRDIDYQLQQLSSEPPCLDSPYVQGCEDAQEIDDLEVHRPEQFFTPEAWGVTVPVSKIRSGVLEHENVIYLQHANGKREVQSLNPRLELSDGNHLFFSPIPPKPSEIMPFNWSAKSRSAWLNERKSSNILQLFNGLRRQFIYYVDLPKADSYCISSLLTLWTFMTYFYRQFPAVPYLHIQGPYGSGKSQVLLLLQQVVFRPILSSSVTGPLLFRSLHDNGGVLLLDEAENFYQRDGQGSEILPVLLAGYKRGGRATRLEAIGDTYQPKAFDVYGPKAFGSANRLPPALASRSVTIHMTRASSTAPQPRRSINSPPTAWGRLRDDLYTMVFAHGQKIMGLVGRRDICGDMLGRDFELWQPILAIASLIEKQGEKGLVKKMREFALRTIEENKEDRAPEAEEILIQSLARLVLGETIRPTATQVQSLSTVRHRDFSKWTAKRVANVLRNYGFKTSLYNGKRVYNNLSRRDFERASALYGFQLDLSFPEKKKGEDAKPRQRTPKSTK